MALTRCSVVIPVHNRASLTRQCLDALLDEGLPEADVIVVDDASSDETPELLASYGDRVRGVRLDENRGFAGACNAGVAASESEFVVLLNNDTRPTPGWLTALVAHADAHPQAAIVGAKLLWPTGAVQHAGVAIDANKDVRHIYAGFPGDHPAVNKARRFQVVTAACVLIRRALFEEMGGLDTAFRNGYEDVDFCLRVGAAGHEVRYCPDSVVYHLESASRGYETEIDLANRDLYLTRWRERVRHDDFSFYVEDGLLELKYEWLSVNPEVSPLLGKAKTATEDNVVERALDWRSRLCFLLIRENARLALAADAPAPWGAPRAQPSTNGAPRASEPTNVTVTEFMDVAGDYERWPSGLPYDWGGAVRGESPYDNLDFHLDLGCGNVKKGRIGLDRFPAPGVNVVCDLEHLRTYAVAGPGEDAAPAGDDAPIHEGGLPFADGSIHSIVAHHCLEHLGDGFVAVMDECWRVLKPGGFFRIIAPLFPSWSAVVDPDHKRYFVADPEHSTFDYFCGEADDGFRMEDFAVSYTRARFERVDQDITRRSESPAAWWTPADARELRVTLKAAK